MENSASLLLLHDYSKFHLALHFPSQLRCSRNELLDSLPISTLSSVLQLSYEFLQGTDIDNRDLSLLTCFAADKFGKGDIYRFLHTIGDKFKLCKSFDRQTNSKMREFMLSLSDPAAEHYNCNLIQSDDYITEIIENLNPSSGSQHIKEERIINHKEERLLEKTFVQEEIIEE